MSGSQVAKNSVVLIVTEAARRIISFVVAILIARALTVEDFGRFGVAMALSGIFGVIAGFGLNPLLTRLVATDPQKGGRRFGTILGLKMIFGLTACLLMTVVAKAMGYDGETFTAVVLASLLMPAQSLEEAGVALFDGYQRMIYSSLITLVKAVLLLVCIGAAVWTGQSLIGLLFAYLIGSYIAALLAVALVQRVAHGVSMLPEVALWKPLVREAVPFFFIGLVWMVAFRVDTVMLERMVGEEQTGLYRSGYAFFEMLLALPILATRALFPALSQGMAAGGQTWRKLLNASLRIYLMAALPVSIGGALIGARMVPLFYGAKYEAGGQVVALLTGFLWLWFGTMTFGWALTAADRLRTVLFGNLTAMLVNISANLLLIPHYGFLGATAATVMCEATLLAIFCFAMQRHLGGLSAAWIPWRALPAGLLLAAVVWPLRNANLALPIAAGAVVYVLGIWLSGALKEEERKLLLRLIKRSDA